jgi:hypothetical protein
LGPLLFVIYINDLPKEVASDIFLFADDTKIFRIIYTEEDRNILQEDLTKMHQWSDKWLLKFHPAKCKSMSMGRERDSNFKYKFDTAEGAQYLDKVTQEKDVGVIIDNNLEFEAHICEKVNKATRIFGIIRRAYRYLDEENFILLYKALVRSQLDHASSVWSPYKQKYIEQIENVQRRATRQIPSLKNLSYPDRLWKLKLPTLTYRRIRGDMINTYKILRGQGNRRAGPELKLRNEAVQQRELRGHAYTLIHPRCNKVQRKNAFPLRIITSWNSLSSEVVEAPDLDKFKNRLDKFWKDCDLLYDHKAPLPGTEPRIGRI